MTVQRGTTSVFDAENNDLFRKRVKNSNHDATTCIGSSHVTPFLIGANAFQRGIERHPMQRQIIQTKVLRT